MIEIVLLHTSIPNFSVERVKKASIYVAWRQTRRHCGIEVRHVDSENFARNEDLRLFVSFSVVMMDWSVGLSFPIIRIEGVDHASIE